MRRLWQLHHLPPNERVVPCPTFAQCWEEWCLPELTEKLESGEISKNTVVNYRSAWRSKVSPRWSSTQMNKVEVEEYLRHFSPDGGQNDGSLSQKYSRQALRQTRP